MDYVVSFLDSLSVFIVSYKGVHDQAEYMWLDLFLYKPSLYHQTDILYSTSVLGNKLYVFNKLKRIYLF